MKKNQNLLLTALFILATLNINAQASDLFFSEYAEGSSFNKYVEIANATGAEVDLSVYQIKKAANGNNFTSSLVLSGMLPDGAVYIISNSQADPQILALADETDNDVINFNGNDAMGLFKNDVLIDIIGIEGNDPGDGWDVAGVVAGTKDHTLVRKPDVCDPTTDWNSAAGTNADDSQWVVYDQNYWDELGMHTSDCGGGQNVATPTFSPPGGVYLEEINVEISCSTPDASIYYTLDGSDPDENSTAYTEPIPVNVETTIKARAYASELDPSNIAQADYTFSEYTSVPNLTELRDSYSGGNETFVVTGEVVLTFQQDFRGHKYIQDDFAAILIDDYDGIITTQYEIGDGITGITGILSEYGNMLQFVPVEDPGTPTSNGNQVTPAEITIADMISSFEDYESQLVKVSGVSFADQGSFFEVGTVYPISDGSKADGNFRTTFYDADYIGTIIPAGEGEIIGILNSRTDGDYISSRSLDDLNWGVMGEPSNYPTDFAVSASGTSIMLSWADATGEVVPSGYLVMLSDSEDFTLPVDGTPVLDDTDLTDGMGAKNVGSGVGTFTFSDLMENTTYYAVIVPYTNSGTEIEYKTDGVPPGGSATTEEAAPDILFTTFNDSWENWTMVSVEGDQVWSRDNSFGLEDSPCALMSGYSGEPFENEDWLISPMLDFTTTSNEMVSFYSATNYDGPALEFKISTDYDGSGNPNDFTWTDLSENVTWSSGDFVWTESGVIDISSYSGESLYLAFTYYSTTEGAANWEIDNIRIQDETGLPENLPAVNLSIWPNPSTGIFHFNAMVPVQSVDVYNIAGMLVYQYSGEENTGQLDLSSLEKGIYVARIQTGENHILSRRIVIQ